MKYEYDGDDKSQIDLWNSDVLQSEYGDSASYIPHVLIQYKLDVEMADNISQRRSTANTFFLTLNTFVIGIVILIAVVIALMKRRADRGGPVDYVVEDVYVDSAGRPAPPPYQRQMSESERWCLKCGAERRMDQFGRPFCPSCAPPSPPRRRPLPPPPPPD